MKRIISLLLALVTISCTLCVYGEKNDEYAQTYTISTDFEDEGSDEIISMGSRVKLNDEHGTVMELNSADGRKTFSLRPKQPVECEAAVLRFDVMTTEAEAVAFTMLEGENKSGRNIVIEKGGEISYADMSNAWPIGNRVSYKANEWHTFTFWFDYKDMMCTYYYDDELWGTTALLENFGKIKGFTYFLEPSGVQYIDNMSFSFIKERGKQININVAGKEKIENYAETEINSQYIGNNFFDENVSFDVDVKNEKSEKLDAEVNVRVIAGNGKTAIDQTRSISAEAKAAKKTEFSFVASYFGFYKVYVTVTEKNTGRIIENQFDMAVMNGPKDGRQNPRMGINNHFWGNDTKRLKEYGPLMRRVGFSSTRQAYDQEWIMNNNEWQPWNAVTESLDDALDNNIQMVWIVGSSKIHNNPEDEQAKKEFEQYCRELAIRTKGKNICIELFNEVNLNKKFKPELYVKYCEIAYTTIKSINPDMKILGLSGVANVDNMMPWIRECMDYGAGKWCDAVAIHPYPFGATPETASTIDKINETREIMKEYGYPDMEVWSTEAGWTASYCNDDLQAYYTVRYLALSHDISDVDIFYNLQEKPVAEAGEKNYGWMRSHVSTYAEPYSVNLAKPVLMVTANYNRIMIGAETNGEIKSQDKNVFLRKFRLEDGRDCIMAWDADSDNNRVTLKLGCNSVTVSDVFGNEKVVYGVDGCFEVDLSGKTKYIMGNFSESEIDENRFSVSATQIDTTVNDTFRIAVSNKSSKKIKVDAETPDNIKLEGTTELSDGRYEMLFATGENGADNEIVAINVRDFETGQLYYSSELSVNYNEDARCDIKAQYDRSNRWKVNVDAVNLKQGKNISGEIVIDEPQQMQGKKIFNNVVPGGKYSFSINIPEYLRDVKMSFSGRIILDNKKEIPFNEDIYFTGFAKVNISPKIDGVIEDGEWNKSFAMALKYPSQIKAIKDYGGESDLSANAYAMWDKDNFYLAAEVTDDILGDASTNLWSNDSIQFAFADKHSATGKTTEFCLALNKGEPQIKRYSYMAVDTSVVAQEDKHNYDAIEYAIKRVGNKTCYELKMPWAQIYGKPINPMSKSNLIFSMLINENDGNGRRGWIEYCPGIGGEKFANLFIKVPIIKK